MALLAKKRGNVMTWLRPIILSLDFAIEAITMDRLEKHIARRTTIPMTPSKVAGVMITPVPIIRDRAKTRIAWKSPLTLAAKAFPNIMADLGAGEDINLVRSPRSLSQTRVTP